jgi:hypothetical protein
VRIQDGEVSAVSIEKAYVDTERGHRSLGFRGLLSKFGDKVHAGVGCPLGIDVDPVCSCPTWTLRSTRKQKVGCLPLGSICKFPISRYKTLPVCSCHITCLSAHNLAHCAGGVTTMLDDFTPDWQGKGNVWEAYRRTCPPGSPARQLYSSYRNPTIQKANALLGTSQDPDDSFTFAETVDDDYDFCKNPWAHYTQGHFFSDWRTIPVLSPVFSPSKPKGFADIRIPSHYYQGGNPRYSYAYDSVTRLVKEIDDMEVPWDQKSDHIFWRGATTGGGSTPPGFTPTYQRHRYLIFLNLPVDSPRAMYRSDSSVWRMRAPLTM